MTPIDFNNHVAEFQAEMDELLLTKGADYTPDQGDRLSNFKDVANALGLTPMQVWAVYAYKHFQAILNAVRSGRSESEPIHSRFLDLANYALLGDAITSEESRDLPSD